MSIISFQPCSHKFDAVSSFFAYDPYIERFWQPILGPTATGLLNVLCLEALNNRDSFNISILELSRRTGTGARSGSSSPVMKQLTRLANMGLLAQSSENEYEISPQVPVLSPRCLSRLNPNEFQHHDLWLTRLFGDPLTTQKNKVNHLVMTMTMMGHSGQSISSSIENSGLHPSIIGKFVKSLQAADVA